jgi:hypothetical protein
VFRELTFSAIENKDILCRRTKQYRPTSIALSGVIVLEEAVDLSSDRLLIMMIGYTSREL